MLPAGTGDKSAQSLVFRKRVHAGVVEIRCSKGFGLPEGGCRFRVLGFRARSVAPKLRHSESQGAVLLHLHPNTKDPKP